MIDNTRDNWIVEIKIARLRLRLTPGVFLFWANFAIDFDLWVANEWIKWNKNSCYSLVSNSKHIFYHLILVELRAHFIMKLFAQVFIIGIYYLKIITLWTFVVEVKNSKLSRTQEQLYDDVAITFLRKFKRFFFLQILSNFFSICLKDSRHLNYFRHSHETRDSEYFCRIIYFKKSLKNNWLVKDSLEEFQLLCKLVKKYNEYKFWM